MQVPGQPACFDGALENPIEPSVVTQDQCQPLTMQAGAGPRRLAAVARRTAPAQPAAQRRGGWRPGTAGGSAAGRSNRAAGRQRATAAARHHDLN